MAERSRVVTINGTFDNFSDLVTEFGDPLRYNGSLWQLHLERVDDQLYVNVMFRKNPDQDDDDYQDLSEFTDSSVVSNLWSVDANLNFSLCFAEEETMRLSIRHNFMSRARRGGPNPLTWDEIIAKVGEKDRLVVNCKVTINSVTGLYHRDIFFNVPRKGVTDVALVLKCENDNNVKFYVSKSILACFSRVFETMFFADNWKESESDEIFIDAQTPNCVEAFLLIIYGHGMECVDGAFVEELLELADSYDVPRVTSMCEIFLITSVAYELSEKFLLAEKFKLPTLQENCADRILTGDTLKHTCEKIGDDMGPYTTEILLKKALTFL